MSKELEFTNAENDIMIEATRRVMHYAHKLAEYDNVQPGNGMFHTLNYVAQELAGLKQAVENYDKAVAYFSKSHGDDE